jgi:hypothetical protein
VIDVFSEFERSIIGALNSNDPKTGIGFDDTRSYIDKAPIGHPDRPRHF